MSYAVAAAAAITIIGGMMSESASSGDREAAQKALKRGMLELDRIGMPPDLSKRILYENFQQIGLLSPEMEQDIKLAGSQVELIKEDPRLREAELEALSGIQQRAKVGISAEDRLALNQIRKENAVQAEGKRQQILQNFASRGQGGSGSELIASLQASQAGDSLASEQGDRLAAMKSQASQAALDKYASLAGNIRSQDFGVASAKAQALDKFSLADFNAANQRQARNISSQNQADASNLQTAQQISSANTQMENTGRLRMEQAKRDYWNDKLARAGSYMGAGSQTAQGYNQSADRTANMYSGIGSGIGSGLGAYGQKQSDDEQAQKNRDNQLEIARMRYN